MCYGFSKSISQKAQPGHILGLGRIHVGVNAFSCTYFIDFPFKLQSYFCKWHQNTSANTRCDEGAHQGRLEQPSSGPNVQSSQKYSASQSAWPHPIPVAEGRRREASKLETTQNHEHEKATPTATEQPKMQPPKRHQTKRTWYTDGSMLFTACVLPPDSTTVQNFDPA
jgi:hypothetical protein